VLPFRFAYFFFAAFFAAFLAGFLAAFFVAMVFYSPFFDVTSTLQHFVAVNECIEFLKNSVKKKIAFLHNQFWIWNRPRHLGVAARLKLHARV
jgi:hypothetical protein